MCDGTTSAADLSLAETCILKAMKDGRKAFEQW